MDHCIVVARLDGSEIDLNKGILLLKIPIVPLILENQSTSSKR